MPLPEWKVTVPISLAAKPIAWIYKTSRFQYLKHVKKYAFIFEEYIKHVTIYQNGHGILTNTFIVNILNKNNFTRIEREIDIHDARKDTYFKPINYMLNVEPIKRFSEMGFWYEPKGLINQIIPHVDEESKNLQWSFLFDKNKIDSLKSPIFSMSYALSIPGMFPIVNMCFDEENAACSDNSCESYLGIQHKINKLEYIISIEKGVKLEEFPKCKIYPHGKEHGDHKEVKLEDRSDIFYDRYVATIKKPELGSAASINWRIKKE